MLERFAQRSGKLGLLTGEAARQHLDQLHIDSQPVQRLGKLDRDGAAADDDEARWDRLELPDRFARQVGGVLEPRNQRHSGPTAGAEQDEARLELAHPYRVRADEFGLAMYHLDPERLEVLGAVLAACDVLLDGTDPAPDRGQVDVGLDGRDAELRSVAHVLRPLLP